MVVEEPHACVARASRRTRSAQGIGDVWCAVPMANILRVALYVT
jgi:hypothetical protein